MNENINDIDARIEDGAVKLYGNDSPDDFPVLKAFQHYIDAEQAKARKRIVWLCVFFFFVMSIVISVFVVLLVSSSMRNQTLNDRLIEYAMKDRDRVTAARAQDQDNDNNVLLRTLSGKLEALKTALAEEQSRTKTSATETDVRNTEKKSTSNDAREIERLKSLLAIEKEKALLEREKMKQLELEAYRRKHYPELYEKPSSLVPNARKNTRNEAEEADREIESILNEVEAIDYFGDDDDDDVEESYSSRRKTTKKVKVDQTSAIKGSNAPSPLANDTPVSVKDQAGNIWKIPLE